MKRIVAIAAVVLACVGLTVVGAGGAVAAGSVQPPDGPSVIAARTFETSADAVGAAQYLSPTVQPNPTNWWGRREGLGAAGTVGLWCGQSPTSPSTYPNYPKGTSGRYDVALPDLGEYYESKARFWYMYPSRGDLDSVSFVFHWFSGAESGSDIDYRVIEGLTTTGVTLEYDLTRPANRINLSREVGGLRWRFVDRNESPLVQDPITGVVIYQPTYTGKGATIDNVVVEGYALGPVRGLESTATPGGVDLTWERPYRATDSEVLEERGIEYRIWRKLQSAAPADPWDELAPVPLIDDSATVSFSDDTALSGVSYNYFVAAYIQGDVTKYGQPQTVSGRNSSPSLDVQVQANETLIANGDEILFTYTIRNASPDTLTDITVSDGWGDPAGGPFTLAPDGSTEVTRSVQPAVSGAYTVSVSSAAASLESTASMYVTVINPSIALDVSPARRNANYQKHADFVATVTNTSSDAALTGVQVVLDGKPYEVGSLAPGKPANVLVASRVTSSRSLAASARGTFLPDRAVSDDAGVSVDVFLEQDRIAGGDRLGTGLNVVRRLYPDGIETPNADGRKAVIIASGYGFADALSAASLAGAAGGPLVLVKPLDATQAVLDYVDNELGADYAYVIGGSAAVSEPVAQQFRNRGLTVERLAGSTRYETASKVALEVKRIQDAAGTPVDTVFLATGRNFPDALAASSIAAAMRAPIVLTQPDALPSESVAALTALAPDTVVICGGTGVISSGVESGVQGNPAYGSPVTERMPGTDRYHTAKLIVDWGLSRGLAGPAGIDGVFLATGRNYPDALAAGALAGGADGTWRPLMLTKGDELVDPAASLILENRSVSFVSVIGGSSAVSEVVRASAQALFD